MKSVAKALGVVALLATCPFAFAAQKKPQAAGSEESKSFDSRFAGLEFRCIGPYRGGRSIAVVGVRHHPLVFYFGGAGGGVWKTQDGGVYWENVSDGFFKRASVGAIAVSRRSRSRRVRIAYRATATAPTTAPHRLVAPPMTSIASVMKVRLR